MHMCSICTDDILSVLGISTVNFMPSHAMAKSALNARMEKNLLISHTKKTKKVEVLHIRNMHFHALSAAE